MKKLHLCAILTAITLAAGAASAQVAPRAEASKNPDRMVRTLSAGDIPMLDDVSLILLAGGTPEQALQAARDSKYIDKGFWSEGALIGDASIRRFSKMGIPEVQARAQLIKKTTKFFIPVALSTPYIAGAQVQFPIAVDGERFGLTQTNASVCAYGRQFCLLIDNVNVTQDIHRNNPGRPGVVLKEKTTMLNRESFPVYGLIVDVQPGVQQISGRGVVAASATRGGFIDLTQCINSVACGVAFEFDIGNGAGVAGMAAK